MAASYYEHMGYGYYETLWPNQEAATSEWLRRGSARCCCHRPCRRRRHTSGFNMTIALYMFFSPCTYPIAPAVAMPY